MAIWKALKTQQDHGKNSSQFCCYELEFPNTAQANLELLD